MKKREEKEIALAERAMEDEDAMFDAEDVTAEEKEKHELSRKIIDMAKDRNRFEMQVVTGPDFTAAATLHPRIKTHH